MGSAERVKIDAALQQLEKAAEQFAFYAEQHAAKRNPDGNRKAMTNHSWALACSRCAFEARAAIARASQAPGETEG